MTVPDNPSIFRMVHWQNVKHILLHGICCREHANYDPNYVNIGHTQLIGDRHQYPIPLAGAGNLGEYVPFYFAGHTPMLYLIKNGFKGVTQRPQEDIIYILCKVNDIYDANLEFVFTDRNAKIAVAEYYDDLADLDKLEWEIIKNQDWKNTETNLARQDFKQAEFLIKNYVPVELIRGLIVFNNAKKKQMEDIITELDLDITVYIDKNRKLYY
jgi:hypothetical protein